MDKKLKIPTPEERRKQSERDRARNEEAMRISLEMRPKLEAERTER